MTDDQTTRLPPGYRPRRPLSVPMLAEHERPEAEAAMAREHEQLPKRRRWPARGRR